MSASYCSGPKDLDLTPQVWDYFAHENYGLGLVLGINHSRYVHAHMDMPEANIAKDRWDSCDPSYCKLLWRPPKNLLIVSFGPFGNHLLKPGNRGVLCEAHHDVPYITTPWRGAAQRGEILCLKCLKIYLQPHRVEDPILPEEPKLTLGQQVRILQGSCANEIATIVQPFDAGIEAYVLDVPGGGVLYYNRVEFAPFTPTPQQRYLSGERPEARDLVLLKHDDGSVEEFTVAKLRYQANCLLAYDDNNEYEPTSRLILISRAPRQAAAEAPKEVTPPVATTPGTRFIDYRETSSLTQEQVQEVFAVSERNHLWLRRQEFLKSRGGYGNETPWDPI